MTAIGQHDRSADQGLRLTMFPLGDPRAWNERVAKSLTATGYRTNGGATHLQAWDPARATKLRHGLYLNIGWSLRKTWLGPHSHGLTTIPRKLYFSEPSDQQPIFEREDIVLAGRARPRMPTVDRIIENCLDLASTLYGHGAITSRDPVPIVAARHAVHRDTGMLFGGDMRIPATVTEKDIIRALSSSGPYRVPSGFRIAIVSDEEDQMVAKRYEDNVQEWLRSFQLDRTSGDAASMVATYRCEQVVERLEQRLARGQDSAFDGRSVLVALSGKPGTPIPLQQARLLELLGQLSIPFRCFSLDNKDLKWSSRSQLMSLLQAASGIPYSLELPMPPDLEDVAFLGIDLGHPKAREESWLVLSLIDRHGSLIGAYKCRQRRDETASPMLLASGLEWARRKMETLSYEPAGVVVLRDGRMHSGERMDAYYDRLGPHTTLVEVTKNDNPAMFEAGSRLRYAADGSVVHPLDSSVRFLSPTGQVMDGQGIPRVLKLQMRDECDGLGLGLDTMTSIVAGLVCAPSLGTKPHALPGPIYWADGIARSAPHTYKFAGQPVTSL